jgi:hypothetical protein
MSTTKMSTMKINTTNIVPSPSTFKKARVFLGVMAVVVAAGGAFATQHIGFFTFVGEEYQQRQRPLMTAWEYIPGTGGDPDQCIERLNDCAPYGPNLCTFDGHKLGDGNVISTQCGVQLTRVSP